MSDQPTAQTTRVDGDVRFSLPEFLTFETFVIYCKHEENGGKTCSVIARFIDVDRRGAGFLHGTRPGQWVNVGKCIFGQ